MIKPTSREKIIKVLKIIQQQNCAYAGSPRCDCKYADDDCKNVGTPTESGPGCCEMRVAIDIISKLNDEQWNYLMNPKPENAELELFETKRIKLSSQDVLGMLVERERLYKQITALQECNNAMLKENRKLKSKKRKNKK